MVYERLKLVQILFFIIILYSESINNYINYFLFQNNDFKVEK